MISKSILCFIIGTAKSDWLMALRRGIILRLLAGAREQSLSFLGFGALHESSAVSRHYRGCVGICSALRIRTRATCSTQEKPAAPRKSLPIGVFDPPFNKLSLDEMLDKFASLGIEAVEVGAAGPNGSPHCPRPELVADPAKARAWKKKFDDRGIPVMTLSCHNNALYPDATKARDAAEQFRQTIQLAGMLEIPTVVGFSGCPGGSPTDTVPNWVVYDWPPEHGEALQWQWKERVIPYWRETAKFAREHGVHRIALEMHPNFVVLQSADIAALARGGRRGDRR